ncbi:hypothetical protein GTN66_07605 [bacterium]|nr:hypothetical protein [bacterium]NIN93331.1 hypothetical protein [bacterium]NIO19126.1 hypothetical protein [bacterium]NIO74257.1 hypothetical protein [bacterium]
MRKLIILKSIGILFLSIGLAWADGLIIDGGLESGTTTHWNEWGLKEWSVVDSPVRSGSFAAKLFDAGTGYGYIQQKGVTISPGKTYSASLWVYDNDPDGEVTIRIYWYTSYDGSGSYVEKAQSPASLNSSSYQELTTGEIIAPVDANSANVRAWVSGTGACGERTFYVDDVCFVRIVARPDYEEKPTTETIEVTNSPFFPYDDISGRPAAGKIKYNVPDGSRITLRIFDVRGKLVRVLIDQQVDSDGEGSVTWDGRDDSGDTIVPIGIYICHIEALNENTGKVTKKTDTIVVGRKLR